MGLDKKGSNFKKKFAIFDPHFKIERYSIYFIVAICFLACGIFVSKKHIATAKYNYLMKVDTVGASSAFSKTPNTVLTLASTSLSPDGKTAYIPVTFSSTDNVGIKADDYKIYIRASDGKDMSNKVTGRFIMYGTDNKAVVVLTSDKSFESVPLDLFIMSLKNTKTLDDLTSLKNLNSSGSDTFGDFDVAAFKINPGASDIKANDRITVKNDDMKTIYEKTFGASEISNIYKQIDANDKRIKDYKVVADGLVERLESEGYIVPEEPAWMKDDWKPYDFVNVDSGKTANGVDVSDYDFTDASNPETDKDTVKFPDTLLDKNGNEMSKNDEVLDPNSLSETSDSNVESSNSSSQSPSDQWYNLRTAWLNIKKLKRKNMVDANYQIYKIRQQEKDILDHATISKADHFKQISKVKK